MHDCVSFIVGLLATVVAAEATQYSANMFLNGQYQNNAKSRTVSQFAINPAANMFLEHAIISRQAAPFMGPTYLPPKELLKCTNGQQCVRKSQCVGGYFTQLTQPIKNCDAETDVCCTYRAPPTTPPAPTTTTPKPIYCAGDSDCVSPRDCRNGEIVATSYIKKNTASNCVAPNVCCRMPSTALTSDGYVLRTPVTRLDLPTTTRSTPPYRPQPQPQPQPQGQPQPQPQPQQPRPQSVQPNNQYLPPKPTPAPRQPTQPAPPRQPISPRQPTQPAPPQTPRQPPRQPTQSTPPQTQAPRQPQQPQQPRQPPRQPSQPAPPRPQPQQPRQPSPRPQTFRPPVDNTPNAEYLPPPTVPDVYVPEQNRIDVVTRKPSTKKPINRKPQRGEDQLSPPIFPQGPKSYAKCASALVCTPEEYCNAIGVISDSPVAVTPFRVPLTDCQIEGTGAPGKCCRDSNYVDPWPVNPAGVCATRNRNTKPRGVRDIDANFAEIPWQAMVLKESTKSLLCGGAIVGDEFVLTSAKCVDGVPIPDLRIKAGEWQLGSTDEPQPFQLVGAKNVEIHPGYNPSTGANDMAMIRLDRRFNFAPHIQPICVSDQDPGASESCITTGWGKQALEIHEEGAIMHVTNTNTLARNDCGADGTGVCSATKFDSCEFDVGSALACGSGSSVLLKGIYSVENACGENQAVRFTKPDIKWINTMFAEKSKPLLLLKRV